MLNTRILSIFPNINQVVINTTYQSDVTYYCYRFSLLSFLSEIESSKPSIEYIIKAEERDNWNGSYSKSWLNNNIITESIEQKYKSQGWNIKYQKQGNGVDYIIINK